MGDHNLTPPEAMISAAKRGIDLIDGTPYKSSIEPATIARARKIAAGEDLTPSVVGRLREFFSEHSFERTAGWDQTTPGILHQLYGGDAGKAWANGQAKTLTGAGVSLDEEDDRVREFAEFFFDAQLAEGKVEADDNGLIWKPMLPVGVWKIGPNGRPLKVIEGNSKDQRQAIGLKDIIAAFDDNAVPHVTIPKTHADAVDENTGFVRKLAVRSVNGVKTLFGGHDFTDKKFKQKVVEGSVANTSVGLEFDYQRKDDGKKYPVVLRHNAATNRPWLGRKLATFGEENTDNALVQCAEYVENFSDESQQQIDLWSGALTYGEVRDAIARLAEGTVTDVATDRALIKKGDKTFVAHFTIKDGDVELAAPDKWSERAVKLEDDHTTTPEIKPPSQSAVTITTPPEAGNDPSKETANMADENKDTPVTPAPSATVDLSENPLFLAEQEKNNRLEAQLAELRSKDRTREADDFVEALKGIGLDEEHGATDLLKFTRNILLSDEGDTAINLSEGDAAPRKVSAGALVKELLGKLPLGTDGKLKLVLSEQAGDPLKQSATNKPPLKDESEVTSLSEKLSAADAWFDESIGGPKPATTPKGN